MPTRNPDAGRLTAALAGLAAQTLPRSEWELLLIDNGSTPALDAGNTSIGRIGGRVIGEPAAGLTRARIRGLREARGDFIVFVDDDNVLALDFLERACQIFARHPRLGAAGGIILPSFEVPPAEWTREFFGLLAVRDLGANEIVVAAGPDVLWPDCAPVGAGLCVRRTAAAIYLQAVADSETRLALDRAGDSLASGGDSDLVFTLLHAGWDVGYFPDLLLTHLIPPARLQTAYLARLNEGIQRSWVRVLGLHGHQPWPPIPRWTLPLRSIRAWWRQRAWRGDAPYVRWRGLHGRLLGQADNSTK